MKTYSDSAMDAGLASPEARSLFEQAVDAQRRDDLQRATGLYVRLLNMEPENPVLLANMAALERMRGRNHVARVLLSRSLAANPDHYGSLLNMGNLLRASGEPSLAVEYLQRAVRLQPEKSEGFLLLGLALRSMDAGREDEALRALATAEEHAPDTTRKRRARGEYARTLLSRGNFVQGAKALAESVAVDDGMRFGKLAPFRATSSGQDAFSGKRLVVVAREDSREILLFARYLPALAAAGATVTLACPSHLAPLLAGVNGVARVVTSSQVFDDDRAASASDGFLQLLELPHLLGEVPYGPYLVPPREHGLALRVPSWTEHLLGVCFAPFGRDGGSAADPASFAPLGAYPRTRVVCFSEESLAERAAHTFNGSIGIVVPAQLARAARVGMHLSALIGVDCALLHAAGAMGQTGWLSLTPSRPWYACGGDDASGHGMTRWYPSVGTITAPAERQAQAMRVLGDRLHQNLPTLAERVKGKQGQR